MIFPNDFVQTYMTVIIGRDEIAQAKDWRKKTHGKELTTINPVVISVVDYGLACKNERRQTGFIHMLDRVDPIKPRIWAINDHDDLKIEEWRLLFRGSGQTN